MMLSVGGSHWKAISGNLPRQVLVNKRHASYSKNPMRKTGSFEDLIYNDALFKNKLHLLEKNRLATPERFKITAGDLKSASKKVAEERFPLPDHQYGAYYMPFVRLDGMYIGQKIDYENILPRCKGKTEKLEWKSLTEEDRYTARNFYIYTHMNQPTRTKDVHKDDAGENERINGGGFSHGTTWHTIIWVAFMTFLWYGGHPFSNRKTNGGIDPDDSYIIGLEQNQLSDIPILGDIWNYLWFAGSARYRGYHEQYSYPLWTQSEVQIDSLLANWRNFSELCKITPQWHHEYRDNGLVKPTPTDAFIKNHELYYDGVEGPDRIGGYFVKSWKTGKPIESIQDSHSLNASFWMSGGGVQWQNA